MLVVDGREFGRAAATLEGGVDLVGERDGGTEQVLHRREEGEGLAEGLVAGGPAAGRGKGNHRFGPTAGGKLESEVAAERAADQVRSLDPGLVHPPFNRLDKCAVVDLTIERGAAGVAGQGRREDVVLLLQRRQHQLPGAPGVDETVQTDHRRTEPTAVEWWKFHFQWSR